MLVLLLLLVQFPAWGKNVRSEDVLALQKTAGKPFSTYQNAQRASAMDGASHTPVNFEQGKDYQKLDLKIIENKTVQQFMAEDPKKVQVIEFFNYGCFGCGYLHPIIDRWVKEKSDAVVFYRFPLVFNKPWGTLAKAYYVIKALNANEKLDEAFFTAIHQQRINLFDEKLLESFFVEHGVSKKEFLDLYHSFTVERELMRAKELANAYQISVSPVIIVNGPSGSYLLTPAMAGSWDKFIAVLNYLVSEQIEKLKG
jgi:thiol:disulfide interchange protein DsbA